MARKKYDEDTENHERWLISYADFITLLFAFFVVMYAISVGQRRQVPGVLRLARRRLRRARKKPRPGSAAIEPLIPMANIAAAPQARSDPARAAAPRPAGQAARHHAVAAGQGGQGQRHPDRARRHRRHQCQRAVRAGRSHHHVRSAPAAARDGPAAGATTRTRCRWKATPTRRRSATPCSRRTGSCPPRAPAAWYACSSTAACRPARLTAVGHAANVPIASERHAGRARAQPPGGGDDFVVGSRNALNRQT